MREGEAIFDESRRKWEQEIGADELARLEANLGALVGATVRPEAPVWVLNDFGTTMSSPRSGDAAPAASSADRERRRH